MCQTSRLDIYFALWGIFQVVRHSAVHVCARVSHRLPECNDMPNTWSACSYMETLHESNKSLLHSKLCHHFILHFTSQIRHVSSHRMNIVFPGQYSPMMDSPTSSSWPTQEVKRPEHGCIFVVRLFIRLTVSVSCPTAGGVSELAGKFHISKPQYGLCKVGNAGKGPPHVALISWVSRLLH